MEAIYIKDLTVSYDLKPVLWDVDLVVPNGTLMAIVGPNGAGKSTLIKAILDLVKPVTGKVLFFDKQYKRVRKDISYVPQRSSVDWDFPTTVFDVVLMGRYGHVGWIKRPTKKDKELTIKALEKVDMLDYSKRQISELSGGQQQRVFLARALVQDAKVYLMDEPFAGVDVKTEKAILNILKELKEQGKTLVVVHHDLQTVENYFESVTILNKQIIASGLVKDVFTTENIDKAYKANKGLKEEKNG